LGIKITTLETTMQPSMAMKPLNGKSLVVGERVYVPNSDPENSDNKTATTSKQRRTFGQSQRRATHSLERYVTKSDHVKSD